MRSRAPFRLATLHLLLLPAAAVAGAQPNLLDDPGFALASPGTATSNSAWQANVNLPDGASLAAAFQDAPFASDPADVGNGVGFWFRSFEGGQAPGDLLAQASLEQTVANVGGGEASLTFSVKREAFFLAGAWTATLESSGTGGSAQIDLLASVPADGAWTTRILHLDGVSAGDDLIVRVDLVDGQEAGGNPQSGFVDNFRLIERGGPSPVEIPTLDPRTLVLLALIVAGAGWRILSA